VAAVMGKVAKRKRHQMAKRMIGRYVIADPAICHGQPTFRGTRILVADVMEQAAGAWPGKRSWKSGAAAFPRMPSRKQCVWENLSVDLPHVSNGRDSAK